MEINIETIKKQTPASFSITYFNKIFSEKGYIKDDISVISWRSRLHHQQSLLG